MWVDRESIAANAKTKTSGPVRHSEPHCSSRFPRKSSTLILMQFYPNMQYLLRSRRGLRTAGMKIVGIFNRTDSLV